MNVYRKFAVICFKDSHTESLRSGFTFLELLVVIVIISILAAISASGVRRAKEMARQTDCMSNLRQIGIAIVAYRNDHAGRSPDWISNLYPTYVDDLSVYVCRSDVNKGRGRTHLYGTESDKELHSMSQEFPETIDNCNKPGGRHPLQNNKVEANSYMYEFSCAAYNKNGFSTWAEFKEDELRQGNDGQPFSSSKMPIVRCFHHARFSKVPQKGDDKNPNGSITQRGMTINVAYAGNVVIAPLWWQGVVGPGYNK